MKILAFSILVLLVLAGCMTDSNPPARTSILGTWHLYDAERLKAEEMGGDAFTQDARLQKIVTEGNLFCLFKDGTFTNIRNGSFTTGIWRISPDNQSIYFIEEGVAIDTIQIQVEKNINSKQQLTLSDAKNNLTLKFIKSSEPLLDINSDPFYVSNNRWRRKPVQAEDSTALTARLTNYLKHVALILKAAKIRKENVVSFEYSMGPVQIYNGGIGIHPYQIVPENWKNTYYNESDAAIAYARFEEYLRSSRYRGAGSGNWIEDDYNILLSIYSGMTGLVAKEK